MTDDPPADDAGERRSADRSDDVDATAAKLTQTSQTPDAAAVDAAADSLTAVQHGGDLSHARIAAVDRTAHEVTVTLELASGTTFTDAFTVPPVWGANCELKTLLDAFGLGPDEMDELVDESVPCVRAVTDGGLSLRIDRDAL